MIMLTRCFRKTEHLHERTLEEGAGPACMIYSNIDRAIRASGLLANIAEEDELQLARESLPSVSINAVAGK